MFIFKLALINFLYTWMLLSLPCTSAILNDIVEIIDLSNVDLANYEFFKNLPSQDPRTAAQANPFFEHFQRKKAVLDYLEHLFFGNSPFTPESDIPFDPHFGRAWRPQYERKFGRRGEHLIEMLGHGYSLQKLRQHAAVPKKFLTRSQPKH